jgi:hypothetical protein
MELTPYDSGIVRAYAAAATVESVPFLSRCPGCGQQRLQVGHSRDHLVRKLVAGMRVDAYCLPCDLVWPIGVRERGGIGRGLARLTTASRR